jgi:hypothetical protein
VVPASRLPGAWASKNISTGMQMTFMFEFTIFFKRLRC